MGNDKSTIQMLRDKGLISPTFVPAKKSPTDNYVESVNLPGVAGTAQSVLSSPEKQQGIFDSIFGSAAANAKTARDNAYQDMLNSRRGALEQQRTDAVKMAKYNALGNMLTTMVQPLGWAAGGTTARVQPYDNRAYLEAFNRAVKATDDLRNIGTMEDEYRFRVADEDYRRQLALEDYENKQKVEMEKQKQLFDLRSRLNQEQIDGRIKVAEATARAKYQFKTGNTKVAESVRDNLLKRANTAYSQILADYYKKRQIGVEVQEPPSYDEFLKKSASENGVSVSEGGGTSGNTRSGRSTANLGNTGSSGNSGRSTAKL